MSLLEGFFADKSQNNHWTSSAQECFSEHNFLLHMSQNITVIMSQTTLNHNKVDVIAHIHIIEQFESSLHIIKLVTSIIVHSSQFLGLKTKF